MSRLAKLCVFLAIVLGSVTAAAQTGVISWQAIDQYGQPLPHAQVRVCSATSSGTPCNPTVPIYLDYNLTTPVSNPYAADQYGNFSFYVPALPFPNIYLVQLSPASGITWSYLFNGPGGTGSSGCTTIGSAGILQASNGSGGCEAAYVQVNGVNLANPIAPNIVDSATVTVNNPGTNQISFSVTPGTNLAVSTNSTPNIDQTVLNFTDTSTIHFTNPSGGIESADCVTATNSQLGCSRPDNTTITISGGVLSGVPQLIIQAEDVTLGGKFAAAAGQTLDFNSTLPAPPTGYTNVIWQTDTATGRVSGYVSSTAVPDLQQNVGVGTNQVFIPFGSCSYNTNNPSLDADGSGCTATDGYVGFYAGGLFNHNALSTMEWTGAVLPLWLPPEDVIGVSIVAYSSGFDGGPVSSCGGSGTCAGPWYEPPDNAQIIQTVTGVTGATIGSLTADFENSVSVYTGYSPFTITAASTISQIGLLVTFTGVTKPASGQLNINWPLIYTKSANTLGISDFYPRQYSPVLTSQLPTNSIPGNVYYTSDNTQTTLGSACTGSGTAGSQIAECLAVGDTYTLLSIHGAAGNVASVTNADGTLIFSPTTGNVVGRINLNNTNTWTNHQTFVGGLSVAAGGYFAITGPSTEMLSGSNPGSAGQCWLSQGSGVTPIWGSCGASGSATVGSAEVVAFSATPTFSSSFNVSRIVLTGNVTSFTIGGSPSDGQDKTLCFKQGSGPYTVAAPAAVHGFMTIGTVNAMWNCQTFVWDNTDSIWLATTPGVIND